MMGRDRGEQLLTSLANTTSEGRDEALPRREELAHGLRERANLQSVKEQRRQLNEGTPV